MGICKRHVFLWIAFYLLIQSSLVLGSLHFRSREYTLDDSCKLQDRLDNGCAELKPEGSESLKACTSLCQGGCTGVVFDNSDSCIIYKVCPMSIPCAVPEFKFFRKSDPCQHNSTWDITTDTCKCVNDWVGERCERLPVHCGELREFGYPTGTKYERWVKLDIPTYHEPLAVLCNVHNTYENIVIMRSTGQFANNKTWMEYVDGFHYDSSNFWLGLEKMKALTDASSRFAVLTAGFTDASANYTALQRAFYDFRIHGASAGYAFDFNGGLVFSSGPYKDLPYGDCLSSLVGAKFSTWDNDNDQSDTSNCAAEAGVGWWFKDCAMVCNPLGWNYNKLPGPETMEHVKMEGIDYKPGSYAKTSLIYMYFHSSPHW